MLSVNIDNFLSSFPICMPFVSLLSFVKMVKTSNTVLNRSDENVCLCIVSDLKGKAFSLSPLGIILTVGFFVDVFIRLRTFLSILTLFGILNWQVPFLFY